MKKQKTMSQELKKLIVMAREGKFLLEEMEEKSAKAIKVLNDFKDWIVGFDDKDDACWFVLKIEENKYLQIAYGLRLPVVVFNLDKLRAEIGFFESTSFKEIEKELSYLIDFEEIPAKMARKIKKGIKKAGYIIIDKEDILAAGMSLQNFLKEFFWC